MSLATPSTLQGQLQLSVVSGRVLGPDGAPMPNAQVALLDPLGQAIDTVASDDDDRFRLPSVPPGVNFGNPFSGTHFGAPRSLRLELRLSKR